MRATAGVPHSAEFLLALVIAPLTSIASAGGLAFSGLYREPAGILPAMRGQDLVTLAVAPLLLVAAGLAVRGRVRARLIEIGLVGYILYTYAGAAFGYRFNPFLLIYIALCSMSVVALVVALRRFEGVDLRIHFDAAAPRRQVAGFLAAVAAILGVVELGEIGRYLVTGTIPEGVRRAGDASFFPYVLDLGFVAPLSIAAAIGLWRDTAWGYALAAVLLIKATTMGSALLSMNWLMTRAGEAPDGLTPFYLLLTAGGALLSISFFRHCRQCA